MMTSLNQIDDTDLRTVLDLLTPEQIKAAHDQLMAIGRGPGFDMHDALCARLGTIRECRNA